ncbi:osmoprotectant transport system substrate-binding protein [Micromonospora coriariae]|uniref:Osmoprotectant transport system substrate-binding protein n=1 Tax=Micromonospora coriariae TaxID=285665 RepID=A0A1C4U5C4_9ACTN|nr:glycine betaine ABC transporter substrate-binding protein [Micromonospora coriariae]SCE66854.1 osmoprotectant transport system substrate-binding protein [Micromonospora coriariae]
MRNTNKRGRWPLLTGALALVMLVAACGSDGNDDVAGSGSIGEKFDLGGATVTVGSKEFTEQLVLGNLTKLALTAAGAKVEDQIGLQGSTTVRAALTSGEIDLYWEYLGTGWVTYLKNEKGIPGAKAQFEAVRDADAANGVTWLDQAPFNDTYAIAASNETAERLGVASISDLAALVASNPADATFCVGGEFSTRPDGLPGLEKAYGFKVAPDNVSNVQDALVYNQVDKGECAFGSITSTDGRVGSLGLTVLTDDKQFFPPFNGSLNVRSEVLNEHPEIKDIFAPIAAALDDATMVALNAKVDVDGEEPADVAKTWLTENGYIG